jgi:prepilin peptidase CpaA
MHDGFSSACLTIWAGVLAYHDIRYRRLPNALTLGAWVFGVLVLVTQHASFLGASPLSVMYAVGLGTLLTLPAYIFKRLGAGDVKMLVAVALLTSLPFTMTCFVVAALAGSGIALAWIWMDRSRPLFDHLPSNTPAHIRSWLLTPLRTRSMPYGALFALGIVVSIVLRVSP